MIVGFYSRWSVFFLVMGLNFLREIALKTS